MTSLFVFFGVEFRRFAVMLGCMQRMAVGNLGMAGGLVVIAGFMVLGGFAMVFGRMLVMVRGLFVVLVDLVVFHRCLPGSAFRWETHNRRVR
jgi:hypothetical protein